MGDAECGLYCFDHSLWAHAAAPNNGDYIGMYRHCTAVIGLSEVLDANECWITQMHGSAMNSRKPRGNLNRTDGISSDKRTHGNHHGPTQASGRQRRDIGFVHGDIDPLINLAQ